MFFLLGLILTAIGAVLVVADDEHKSWMIPGFVGCFVGIAIMFFSSVILTLAVLFAFLAIAAHLIETRFIGPDSNFGAKESQPETVFVDVEQGDPYVDIDDES